VALAEAETAVPHDPAPDTVWGAGTVDRLAEVCARAGARRVMAVAGQSADGVAERLPAVFGQRYIGRWSDVPAHVPAHQASLAVGSAQETHADGIVAIGGGSAIGLAKIVALALRLPLVAVPTTLSGAEMTSRYLVSTDTGVETGTSPRTLAAAVVYDPELLAPVPPVTLTGAVAVAHCVEALSRPGVPGKARDFAREALPLLWSSLPGVAAGTAGQSGRQDALAGASLAGRAHQAAGPGLLHLVCELATGRHVASYSVLSGLLLPYVLRAHGAEAEPARAALGDLRPGAPAETILGDVAATLGVTATLDGLGIRASLHAVAVQVADLPGVREDPVASAAAGRLRDALAVPGPLN
jgi:maleylacetate reductase